MTRRFLVLLAAVGALAFAACKTNEQKLVDRRRDLRATLDRVYADYTAGAAPKPDDGSDAGVFGRIAGEVDRAWFESQCLAVGRGERSINLSARLEAFLKEDRNARACREVADLDADVAALERKVAAERR